MRVVWSSTIRTGVTKNYFYIPWKSRGKVRELPVSLKCCRTLDACRKATAATTFSIHNSFTCLDKLSSGKVLGQYYSESNVDLPQNWPGALYKVIHTGRSIALKRRTKQRDNKKTDQTINNTGLVMNKKGVWEFSRHAQSPLRVHRCHMIRQVINECWPAPHSRSPASPAFNLFDTGERHQQGHSPATCNS